MRHSYRYLFALAVLLAFTACSKHSRVDERLSETISISSGGVTKALLGANGIDADGTRLQVYDYLSNFSGTIMVNGVEKTYETTEKALYFSDVIDYPGGAGAWTYESGNSYRWTRTGSHTFFGWLLDDAGQTGLNAESFFGTGQPSFNTTTQTLSVPATTLTASGDQFDFLYAPAMTRNAGDPNYTSTVPLHFRHLFTAVKIAIQNVSDNTVQGRRHQFRDRRRHIYLAGRKQFHSGFQPGHPGKERSRIQSLGRIPHTVAPDPVRNRRCPPGGQLLPRERQGRRCVCRARVHHQSAGCPTSM